MEIMAFESIFQHRNRPFYDCLGNILHRRSYTESAKFTSLKGLTSNQRVFRMASEDMEDTTKDERGFVRK